jgi:hypothetical protein
MGTRGLIAVVSGGKYKVANYGQWDHYPEGQGVEILAFLRTKDTPEWRNKVKKVKRATEKECKVINKMADWPEKYPHLSRDAGSKILDYINDNDEGLKLLVDPAFANDSLFCEWAYVINLDSNCLEVYKGFNLTPLKPHERFYGDGKVGSDGYYPVQLVGSYSLFNLPDNATFINELDPQED